SPGCGLHRANHRRLWTASTDNLPTGTVILGPGQTPHLVLEDRLMQFGFPGWTSPAAVPLRHEVTVLTPPTSVAALRHGFVPVLHPSATL
ncbi:MAG: hypothetical protein OEO77_01050, partial [Acidimicrobiia bacterium]|nr:hypothetical protein [Acidimicrobiia bacterium]